MLNGKKLLFLLSLMVACNNTAQVAPGNEVAPEPTPNGPPALNLPVPNANSAEITLGGNRHTLTHHTSCSETGGIVLYAGPGLAPGLILGGVSFSANGEVALSSLTANWFTTLDEVVGGVTVNWGTTGCRGWAIGNEAGFFELQVADCPLQDRPTNPTKFSTVSFRLRCPK